MANEYDIGDLVRVSLSFTNSSQSAADPSTVRGRFRDPSGNVTTYLFGTDSQLVKDATGAYHFDVTIDEAGDWRYRGEGEGAIVAAAEGRFHARESAF
jgi:hypothetical protein